MGKWTSSNFQIFSQQLRPGIIFGTDNRHLTITSSCSFEKSVTEN